MNLMIVLGMFVCSSFLISVCMFMVSKALLCCSDCVGVCGNVCCVVAVVKNSVFLALEC